MTKEQFLEKYGHETVYFSNMNKYRAAYKNEKLKIWCSGVLIYWGIIFYKETVKCLSDLDDFEFGFISENDSID